MAAVHTVALAGATGNLGPSILKELLRAGFKVTILTRQDSQSASSLPSLEGLSIKEVDYASPDSLASALGGIDAVVSTMGSRAVPEQKTLIEAAVSAGVRRFVPSEFGCDTVNPNNAKLPVYGSKVMIQELLKEKAASNPGFSYTLLMNNAFWNSGVRAGLIVNIKEHTATVVNGGNVPFSVTRLSTIGRAVVGVLKNLEATRNRAVYVHDAVVTQQQLIDIVKKLDGKDWSTTSADTDAITKDSYEELKRENPNVTKAMLGFIRQALWGKENGGDFSGKADNQLLGIPVLNQTEVEQVMEEFVKG